MSLGADLAARPGMWRSLRGPVVSGVIAVASVAALLALWQGLAHWNEVPRWLVPRPSDFLHRLWSDLPQIAGHAWVTSLTIIQGFVMGVLVAVPLALVITRVGALRHGLFPLIIVLNIMPKSVIGPILIIWLGISPFVAALIVFLMCFFPILVDAMEGFGGIDRRMYHISRSMGAGRWQTFWKISLPAALPQILSGMRIGIVKAVEGVIIAEFIASNAGLGFMIMRASGFMDMSLMFAGIIAAAVVALLFGGAMALLERWLMPWAAAQR